MPQNRESLSEQARRRTSWILSVLGLVVLILFIMVWCSVRKKEPPVVPPTPIHPTTVEDTISDSQGGAVMPEFGVKGAQLVVTPTEISMDNVVLGSTAEAILVLRAEQGPIRFAKKSLAEITHNGFELSGSCWNQTQLEKGEECLLKVSWRPEIVQSIQNTLILIWREDSSRVFESENQRTLVQLKASSTDSKECVCCEIEKEGEKEIPQVVDAKGEEISPEQLAEVEKIEEGVGMDEKGDPILFTAPEHIALSLDNEYLGRVTEYRTVKDEKGTVLGRLLGDNTLVDSDFKILGAAVPVVSVIDAQGKIIGKTVVDEEGVRVVDIEKEGQVIGTLRVDSSVVDKTGVQIGTLRPWGGVLDLSGNYMGFILPSGAVVDGDEKTVGYIQQNGFATDENGTLIGGVIPRGVAVGTGCRAYGAVELNGKVKDKYGQIVGRAMLDGGIVDTNFNEIGHAVNQGLVVNMKGNVVGFVNSEGKAVDGRGSLMGCVAPNGTVAAGKKMVGGVLQKGMVTGEGCGVIGSVYPDAKVMSPDMREVGKVRADGYALNASNKVMGMVVPHGTVMAENCRLVGVISVTGQILNEKQMSVGCINMQKQAVDLDGKEVGKITPTGPDLAADGRVIGRIRYDGRVIDKQGKIIDCVSPAEERGSQDKGVVLDANGLLTPWTVLAGKCFNERNEEIGSVSSNGWVFTKQGRMIGFMPSDSIVFSDTGTIVGRYSHFMGAVMDDEGETIGRLMPDGTVLNEKGTKILGAAIPQNATFVGIDGEPLGHLNYEGAVIGETGTELGSVLADGSLYDQNRTLIGGVVSSGTVLASNGKQIGWANANGEVLLKGTRIANLLPNGLAVTPDNRVLGRVSPPISVLLSSRGVIGTIVPKAVSGDNLSYQLAGYDRMESYLGVLSPFGVLMGADGRLNGLAVPVSMVMNLQNQLMGWVNFSGSVVNADGQELGVLTQGGLVLNAEGTLIGKVLRKGTVVDATGKFMGRVGSDGFIYNGGESTGLFVGPDRFVLNNNLTTNGRLLSEGIAISNSGKVLGWTTLNGSVVNAEQLIGSVTLNDRVIDADGKILSGFVPLGAPSVQDDEKMCGVVTETGAVVSAAGRTVGTASAPDYVVQNNMIVGRIRSDSLFARNMTNDDLVGVADLDGLVFRTNTARQVGLLMMNDFIVDAAKKVIAGIVHSGFGYSTNLKALGAEDMMGALWLTDKIIGATSGSGLALKGPKGVIGGVFEPEFILDWTGREIGQTNALAGVVDSAGKKVASRMAFDSALTPENIWAGGPLKTGAIVDDYAHKVGVVMADGTIMNANIFKGRILPDGSAAGVSEQAVYNTMPYVGHLTTQGLPMGYSEKVLGRTTVQGDLIDASGKIIYQTLDDGTILGKEKPLEGIILTFRPAVSYHDEYLGVFDGNGQIVLNGNEVARVSTNGALVPQTLTSESMVAKLKEVGGLIPETLIVNDSCAVIGQPAYTGEVINGQGKVVARVQPTLFAVDSKGRQLGRSVRYGPVTTMDEKGVFIGRTLPDSTVVDPAGVRIGCVRGDRVLVDANGNELGRLRNRGPVFDKNKKMVGRVDAMGRVVGFTGEVMGVIGGGEDDVWYDTEGNERGWMFDREKRLLLNPDGTLEAAIDREGWVVDATNTKRIRVDQTTGDVYDTEGRKIGNLNDEHFIENLVFLYDMQNNIVARLHGCELFKHPSGEKMGSILANGEIRDENNEVILKTEADGRVYNPDRTQFGRFGGIGLDLRRCGLSSATTGVDAESGQGGSGQPIIWGNKKYTVDPEGMILNEKGEIVGVWNPLTNRPYIWDEDRQTFEEDREPPPTPQPYKIPPDVLRDYADIQRKRRTQMKQKIGEQGSLVLPGYKVEEMTQNGVSKDWSSVGVEKSNVSTWPVDMSRVLLADKAVPAVLVRSIDSRYPEVPVTAIVERHIYAEAGRNILIPAGSRLIGSLEGSGFDFGRDQAAKISISWKRLIRPDGAAFKFEAVSGDAQGRGGVAAYLDLQLLKKFALPFVSSLGEGVILKLTEWNEKASATAATTTSSGGTTSETAASQTRKMFIDNFKDVWKELMAMAGEIPNVVYVPSGTRLTAFSSEDLWLRAEEDNVEKKSDSWKETPKANTLLPDNDSWTNKRSKDNENRTQPAQSEAQDTRKQMEVPPEADMIYVPPDLDDRTVEVVSQPRVQPDKTNSYF